MSTTTAERPKLEAGPPPLEDRKGLPRWAQVLIVIVAWLVVWSLTKGKDTLAMAGSDLTTLHVKLAQIAESIGDNSLARGIADGINALIDGLRRLFAIPTPPSPIPVVGWLGVTAIGTWIGYAVANWRIALLTFVSFVSFGAFGYWQDSIDLLIVTLVSVGFAVLIGFPLAIWMGVSARATRWITLGLDLLQTLPTFVYLIPFVILFGVGPATAVLCTLAYALPPIIRISGFGIRDVSPTVIEATDSLGQKTWQRLLKVQIPMARKTIIVGLNQTILAALAMAIIASYVNGPGLGRPVLAALTQNDFGRGLVPGLLIVVMGIMLDRMTTAASERAERVARGGSSNPKRRRIILGAGLVAVAVAIWYSTYDLAAAIFPETGWGAKVADAANAAMTGFVNVVDVPANAFKNAISYGLLNPLQSVIAGSPWWLAFAAILALGLVIGGRKALVPTVVTLVLIRLLGLWNNSMIVLNMTIVATLLVMLMAVVIGVWMARSQRADLTVRPILDAGQTIPAFVYLIPVLAIFGPTRFTAIVAAIVYAAPAAIKLVADGVRGVNAGSLEASRSVGSTTWQEITKVQLPMAKGSMVLATNQGLLYVLSMVVIGGLVGAQALGYDVVYGIAHAEYAGKGLAAGLSISLLGIMIDRIARSAAGRAGAPR
ncbi:MAG TPA: ABC transporter permease subunit [Marmoricola sp.]|nr:ABC transporter permease subunit [Marmoricola sp.]